MMSWSTTTKSSSLWVELDDPSEAGLLDLSGRVGGILLERVYFVRRRDVALGFHPYAEPVVLVDRALAHRYTGVRLLEVIDSPSTPERAPTLRQALPVFAVDWREAMFYPGARPATIARDRRAGTQIVSASRLDKDGITVP